MTRFARAKGSKSSNEKLPEDATPWSELKRNMVKQEKLAEETKKLVSVLKSQPQEMNSSEWANLDNDDDDSLNILKNHLKKKRKQKMNVKSDYSDCISQNIHNSKRKHIEGDVNASSKKKKKVKHVESVDSELDKPEIQEERKKKKKKGPHVMETSSSSVKSNKIRKETEQIFQGNDPRERDNISNQEREIGTPVMDGLSADNDESAIIREEAGSEETDIWKNVIKLEQETKRMLKKKMKNFACQKPVKKNSINSKPHKSEKKIANLKTDRNNFTENRFTTSIDIGGKTISLMKFQGYYVTKEDWKRLKELRRKMVEEGIEESQIESALKLERRRCEKSLARMKKNVCFQCRKPGHVLSDCPDLQNNVETSTGVCYKCGSTEHKAFTCKVTQTKNFPFAECFICKEKGHIARECPDNPKGLYPKGGCCKLCGDVTHLKKDCPKRLSEMEEQTIKLKLRDDRNLEGLEDMDKPVESNNVKVAKKKPVHF